MRVYNAHEHCELENTLCMNIRIWSVRLMPKHNTGHEGQQMALPSGCTSCMCTWISSHTRAGGVWCVCVCVYLFVCLCVCVCVFVCVANEQ